MKRTANSAYPKVVSNLGSLADLPKTRVAINMIRFMNHYARTIRERAKIIEFFRNDRYMDATRQVGGAAVPLPNMEAFQNIDGSGSMGTKALLGMMQDYFAVGYANTLGFAHANSGDTMTSVMIGGLRTVQNGDFEIFPGSSTGLLSATTSSRTGGARSTLIFGTGTLRAMWIPAPRRPARHASATPPGSW